MIFKKDWTKLQVTHFQISKIKREEIAAYPDDINAAYNTDLGFGGFLEKRSFYTGQKRVIHTGLDVFEQAGTTIIAPFDGYISDVLAINPKNYSVGSGTGEQLICWHSFEQVAAVLGLAKTKQILGHNRYIKIVYGHVEVKNKPRFFWFPLFKKDGFIYQHKKLRRKVSRGEELALVAPRYRNGGWPPHIHIEASLHQNQNEIQLITVQQLERHGLIGAIDARKSADLKAFNLVDPALLFGFNKLKPQVKTMQLKDISRNHSLIEISNLSFEYKKQMPVLQNINLAIENGQLVSILGPSGSGKTTLLNLIASFLEPKQGSIRRHYRAHELGYVFQDNLVYETLTVYRNIWISAANSNLLKQQTHFQIWGANVTSKWEKAEIINLISLQRLYLKRLTPKRVFLKRFRSFQSHYNRIYKPFAYKVVLKTKITKLMDKLDITHLANQKAIQISGGQKQRLAIAKALIKNPRLLIMDEPLNSLDENVKDTTRELIVNIQREFGITLLFVTHSQKEAMLISDRIAILKHGHLVQYDTPEAIYHKPHNEFVARFIGWPQINLVKSDQRSKTFVRPENINIKHSQAPNALVVTRKLMGAMRIYNLRYANITIRISSKLDFDPGDKVLIWWKGNDEKVFKRTG